MTQFPNSGIFDLIHLNEDSSNAGQEIVTIIDDDYTDYSIYVYPSKGHYVYFEGDDHQFCVKELKWEKVIRHILGRKYIPFAIKKQLITKFLGSLS